MTSRKLIISSGDEVGVAPMMFLMSQIYSLLPSLLGLLIHIVGLEGVGPPIAGPRPAAFPLGYSPI